MHALALNSPVILTHTRTHTHTHTYTHTQEMRHTHTHFSAIKPNLNNNLNPKSKAYHPFWHFMPPFSRLSIHCYSRVIPCIPAFPGFPRISLWISSCLSASICLFCSRVFPLFPPRISLLRVSAFFLAAPLITSPLAPNPPSPFSDRSPRAAMCLRFHFFLFPLLFLRARSSALFLFFKKKHNPSCSSLSHHATRTASGERTTNARLLGAYTHNRTHKLMLSHTLCVGVEG